MVYMILYFILAGFGVIFAILYSGYPIVIFSGSIILFPIFGYLLSMITCLLLEVKVENTQQRVYQGEEYKVRIHIRNKCILPITDGVLWYIYGYQIGNKQKQKIKFKVGAKEDVVMELSIKGVYCGAVFVEVKKVVIRDFFHVFAFGKSIGKADQQVIFPKLQVVPLELQSQESLYNDEYNEFYEDHPGNDPSEVFGLREYREGDKMQRIHWKLSSKKDRYMVKEYSDPIVIDTAVICGNGCELTGMDRLGAWSSLLERTAKVSYSLLVEGHNHFVYWYDETNKTGRKIQVKTEQDFQVCIDQLLQCKAITDWEGYINYLIHSEAVGVYANVFYIGEDNRERLEQSGVKLKVVE